MKFQLMLGKVCLGTYRSMRSANTAYNLVELALKTADVDLSQFHFCLEVIRV
uniref:Uncharacterized protein n=1 Tax=Dulem virus 158 TaxID=3145635 RepID=A0AAU8B9E1_9VIRU